MGVLSQVQVELLSDSHDVSQFTCVEPALNDFIHKKALRAQLAHACAVYLVYGKDKGLYGYFTLSPTGLFQESLSNTQARKYQYNPIPAMLLGQFARDMYLSPKGFGITLLREVLAHASTTPGWQVLCVDSYSDESHDWFLNAGFREVKQNFPAVSSDHPVKRLKLYMTRQDISATLAALEASGGASTE